MRLVEGVADVADVDAFVETLADCAAADCAVQAFDARYVVGRGHLERAVTLADRAISRGENVARDRAVEILLYAAGRRQIHRALEMGVDEGRTPVAVVVDCTGDAAAEAEAETAERVRAELDSAPTLGRYDETRVREFFDIGEAELAAADADLDDLVVERVALLVVER